MKRTTNNYEKQVHIAQKLFQDFDQQDMIRRLSLKYDEKYLYLEFLGIPYRILREDGAVEGPAWAVDGSIDQPDRYIRCLEYGTVMTIYDVLCYATETPVLAGDWCLQGELQVILSNPDAGTFTKKYAQLFSGRTTALKEACRRIGGTEPAVSARADVCWQFDMFPFFPIQFRYWDGDDEFEPKIILLWDKNSLKFMRFETTYFALGVLMDRLKDVLAQVEQEEPDRKRG